MDEIGNSCVTSGLPFMQKELSVSRNSRRKASSTNNEPIRLRSAFVGLKKLAFYPCKYILRKVPPTSDAIDGIAERTYRTRINRTRTGLRLKSGSDQVGDYGISFGVLTMKKMIRP